MNLLPVDLLRPDLLWAPFVGLPLLGLGLWALGRRRRARRRLVDDAQMGRFLPEHSDGRALARVILGALAVAGLGVSLLGPVRGYTYREVRGQGLDLVVCIDTSRSMLARDVGPSRLERAKREVSGLLERLEGDRVALVAFSGDAREVAPLTHDVNALGLLLERISPADNRRGGTNLSSALEHALALFDGRTGAHEAIVLLTDGEDLEGEAASTAELAAEAGIRVFVVGVGTEAGGKIPVATTSGEVFLRDDQGQEVISRMDRASLDTLASRTGGAFLATFEHVTPLEELYDARISRLEGRELTSGRERIPHDRYQWSLALALACMVVESGLRERRRVRAAGGRGPLPSPGGSR